MGGKGRKLSRNQNRERKKSPFGNENDKKVMLLTVVSNMNFIFRLRYAAFYGKTLSLQKKSNGMAILRKGVSRAFNLTSA